MFRKLDKFLLRRSRDRRLQPIIVFLIDNLIFLIAARLIAIFGILSTQRVDFHHFLSLILGQWLRGGGTSGSGYRASQLEQERVANSKQNQFDSIFTIKIAFCII